MHIKRSWRNAEAGQGAGGIVLAMTTSILALVALNWGYCGAKEVLKKRST